MHHPKGFPSRLVRLRADAGMTQRDLAKASGLSVPQIGRYEMGTSTPRMTALVKLAKALNVELSELSDADQEPEVVEVAMFTGDDAPIPVTFPKDLFDRIAADAKAHGATIEAQVMALLEFGRRSDKGLPGTFEEVLKETVAALEKMPPLPIKK